MERKGSKRSMGARKKRQEPEPEEPLQPVQEMIEIPVALIEIRERIETFRSLDDETLKDPHSIFKLRNGLTEVQELVESCIQVIKTEGLIQMGLDTTDLRLLSEATNCWMGILAQDGALTDRDGIAMTFLIRGLEILMEKEKGELVAIVNPSKTSQACRVCKCTEDDCSQCIEKIGKPCWWIEPDLCSACAPKGHEESVLASM